jgi:VCBS repeat-containing protein
VTVDAVEFLGSGRVRYRYNLDGDVLTPGVVQVTQVAGQVADLAGNLNASRTDSFNVAADSHAPLALDNTYLGTEDEPVSIDVAGGVLANDSDPDADVLQAVFLSGPSHGSLNLLSDGSFTYTPEQDFHGQDEFTYRVFDGTLESNPATVRINIAPANDDPVARPDVYSVTTGQSLDVPQATGVLANDTDVDGDQVSSELVTSPSHGTVTLRLDGSFLYSPQQGFVGTDTFTYKATDGIVETDPVLVTVTVAPKPALGMRVLTFTSGGVGALRRLEITYEVTDPSLGSFEFAFYGSLDASHDAGDEEFGPRVLVEQASDLSLGVHTIRFDGAPYADLLADLDIPYVLVRAQLPGETSSSPGAESAINFVGAFHNPSVQSTSSNRRRRRGHSGGSPQPLVLRGHDDLDRYLDNPADRIEITRGRRRTIHVSSTLLAQAVDIPTAQVSQVRVQALGGNDYIASDRRRVRTPLDVRAGRGNDTVIGSASNDRILGDEGDDWLRGGRGSDVLMGASENELIAGGRGRDLLFGEQGNDVLLGRRRADTLCGGVGNDILRGGLGDDIGDGGPGDDDVGTETHLHQTQTAVIDELLERGEILPEIDEQICAELIGQHSG